MQDRGARAGRPDCRATCDIEGSCAASSLSLSVRAPVRLPASRPKEAQGAKGKGAAVGGENVGVRASRSRVFHHEHFEASGRVVAWSASVGGVRLYSTVCPA